MHTTQGGMWNYAWSARLALPVHTLARQALHSSITFYRTPPNHFTCCQFAQCYITHHLRYYVASLCLCVRPSLAFFAMYLDRPPFSEDFLPHATDRSPAGAFKGIRRNIGDKDRLGFKNRVGLNLIQPLDIIGLAKAICMNPWASKSPRKNLSIQLTEVAIFQIHQQAKA